MASTEGLKKRRYYTSILKEMFKNNFVEILDIVAACKIEDNFVGDLKRVLYSFKGESGEVTNGTVIFKLLPPLEAPQCQIMDCVTMFKNEVICHTQIIPELQSSLPNNPLQVPCCYLGKEGCLVLEDMSKKNYCLKDRTKGLNLEELKKTLRVVSDLHACSFVLNSSNQEKFEELSSRLQEAVFSERHHGEIIEVFWENALWNARESLRRSDEDILCRASVFLERFQGAVFLNLRGLARSSDVFRVICHGDLWCNNILFRWDNSGQPESVCLLDFQAMRPASCALDILHLICSSSECETVGKHFTDLLQSYYEGLAQALAKKGVAPEFSFQCLLEEVKRKVMFGVLVGFIMIQCSMSESQPEGFALDKTVLQSEVFRKSNYNHMSELCHLRTRQLVKDLIQSGLLIV